MTSGTAVACALLDAAALRLNLGAAAGRYPLIRSTLAILLRSTSTVLHFWNTSWVGRYLGLNWAIGVFRRGMRPPS